MLATYAPGEASAECENGNVTSTEGSWVTGVNGAEAGIVMLAAPLPGNSYRQEYLKDVAEDMAKVVRLNANVSVPFEDVNCDSECLKTKEWSSLEHGAIEFKYYAQDIAQNEVSIGGQVLMSNERGVKRSGQSWSI